MMKKYLYIFLVLSLTAIAGATDYTVYVDNSISDTYSGSATPDCTNYNPSTFACSGGSASAYNSLDDVDAFVDSLSNGTDTATIYWRRGRTWTLTSNSDAINIDKSDTTFDAYGTGAKPIIDGDGSYPNLIGIPVIDVANNASAIGNIENVFIKNLQIVNTHDGSSTNEGGLGIRYTGTGTSEGHYIGGGGVQNCFISMTGAAAISLYRVPATDPILIESNEITRANEYHRTTSASSWPQTINTHDSYTYGHECRNNKIYNTFGEGIGCRGFDIVEYNVVSDTSSSLFYIDMMSGSGSAFSSIVRYNLGYFTNGKTHSDPGITVNDENSTGNNTAIHDQIYGNIIIGAIYGIRIRNQAVTSAFGRTDVFNNTFIDNEKNIVFAHTDYFNDVRFKNNSSIIHSDGESTCQHFSSFSVNGWTNWDIGPNFFYGTGTVALASPLTTDAVGPSGTSANLGKTSGWLSLSACPSLDDFTPQDGSDMIDNANTADLGDSYDEYLNSGEFSDLPDDPDFTIVDQDDYGDEWDFGAIISGTDYEWYFSTSGNDSTGNGSQETPWKSLAKINSQIATLTNGTDSATIYLKRGDTWTLTSNTGIQVTRSDVSIGAYGTGDKPIIDGNDYYPHDNHVNVITIGASGSSDPVTNVHIDSLVIQNTHDTTSVVEGGGGIQFVGTIGGASGTFTGPGSVTNCELSNFGWQAISIYRVPNTLGEDYAVKIENNYIHGTGWWSAVNSYTENGPQAINANDGYSSGHIARHNRIDLTHNEAIGAGGFALVEYNHISGTHNPSIYWDPRGASPAIPCIIRYNLVWSDQTYSMDTASGIRIYDEVPATGSNADADIQIYGNIIAGNFYAGLDIRNVSGGSNYGSVKAYNNTIIDTDRNIVLAYPALFNAIDIRNNASIIHSDVASSCVHTAVWNSGTYPASTTIGPNFYYGDSYDEEADLPSDWRDGTNVFGSSVLGKTSGWKSITACPDLDDFTPQVGSDMIDNANTADLGDSYDEYLNFGEFSDLPDDPGFTIVDQDDYGDEWDFGAIIFGTDYEYFFDDEGSGTICSVGSPCAGSYAQTKLDSYSASGNTITLRFNRGATFNHASNSAFLNIDKSNVFVNAYGSGDKPKIDGGEYYPHNTGFLISIGDDSGSSVTNVHIEDIILQNTHDGESDAAGGGGIIFAGTNNSDYFTGPGSVKNCEFYNLGWGAISIYGVPNSGGSSTAIKIENCTIDRTGLYPQYSVSQSTWPSCIGNNTAFSYGHEIRNCKLTRIYGEGISAALFNVVEYNVVSGTYAGSVYWEPRNSSYTTTSNIRYNLIFRDTDAGAGTYNSTPGIHVHDETSGNGTNTSATINIYGNIVIGMDTGVEITNLDGNSHIGTVNAYGNTLIDCDSNIYTSRPQEFNNLNIKNNASIIHSDAASSCVHIRAYNTTSWSTADISNNFWHGDGWTEESDVVNFNDDALTAWRNDNVFGDANLGKTSGWRSITACPDIDDFTPQAESGMIDNSDAADLGDSYDEYIISGEFSDLPDDPDFTLADQDDYGDEWDFGAIIFGTVETPSTGGGLLAHGLSNISVHGLSDFGVHGLTTEVEPSSHPDLFASWSMENNLNDGKGSADLTAVNGPIAYESSGQLAGSYSLYLDRSSTQSAYITDANLPTGFPLKSGETNREFTAIIWFELDSLDNAQYLLGKYSTDSRRSLGILVRSLNTLQINHGKNSGAAYDVDFHGTTLSADTRYAVAYSSDASNNYRMRLYNLDTAAHIGTDLTGTWDNPISISTADLYVGGRMGSSDTLDGTVEAWIFDAELSTADMDAVILD
jgi:hypothetical protein